MKRSTAAVVATALILALMSPASAQTPSAPQEPPAGAPAPAAASDSQLSNRGARDGSGDADARHCLDLANNPEIIACAEKYRSHRTRK